MEFIVTKELELFLGLGITVVTSILGYIVFTQNRRSWTNRFFLFLSMLIVVYVWVNYISLHPFKDTPEGQLFWIRAVMVTTSFIGPTLFMLIHTFPHTKIRLAHKWRVALVTLMSMSVFASATPLVFKAIHYPNGQPIPIPGVGIPIFFLDFVGLFIVSFILLIVRYIKASGEERKNLLHLLLGVIATFTIMGLTTVTFVVILKTSAGVFLGPLSTAILMAFISYAIVKHHLFNIKVLATKILVALIGSIFAVKVFLDDTLTERITDGIVLLIVTFFGFLLIQSVKDEIKRRIQVARLAKSLERANDKLQEQDKIKTEFLSIASHQLRTPLSIIKGYTELIKENAYGKVGKPVVKILDNIDESNEHLIKLVDEFLNISRIEQGRTQYIFEKFSVKDMVQDVVRELSAKASPKGVSLKAKYPRGKAVIVGDMEKLRHCAYNFIDNAIKYTAQGRNIQVMVELMPRGVDVLVKDNGVGLDASDVRNMFQKFYRSPHIMRDIHGNGLGLYVVKQFTESHGGRVWAKSKGVGKGSEFGFFVPFSPPQKLVRSAARQRKKRLAVPKKKKK